jgi:hypothetical protein
MNNYSHNIAKVSTRGLIFAVGLVLAALLGGLVLLHPAGVYTQLQHWHLVAVPERYTELSFDRNLRLPSALTQKPIPFAFTIHNAQGQTMTYSYTVMAQAVGGSPRQLAAGSVNLADGSTQTVTQTITLPKGAAATEIMVILPNQQQEIHFWLGATQ